MPGRVKILCGFIAGVGQAVGLEKALHLWCRRFLSPFFCLRGEDQIRQQEGEWPNKATRGVYQIRQRGLNQGRQTRLIAVYPPKSANYHPNPEIVGDYDSGSEIVGDHECGAARARAAQWAGPFLRLTALRLLPK